MAGVVDRTDTALSALAYTDDPVITPILSGPLGVGVAERSVFAVSSRAAAIVAPAPSSFDAHRNLAITTVTTAPTPANTGTSLTVTAGTATRFPAAPFNASVWPADVAPSPTNAEIVRIVGISGDTLNITRVQEGTTARMIVAGDQLVATLTVKSLTDIEARATLGWPTFIQATAPTATQTAVLSKWVWVDTSTSPPTVNVEAGTDVATTVLDSPSPDDVQLLTLLGVL